MVARDTPNVEVPGSSPGCRSVLFECTCSQDRNSAFLLAFFTCLPYIYLIMNVISYQNCKVLACCSSLLAIR